MALDDFLIAGLEVRLTAPADLAMLGTDVMEATDDYVRATPDGRAAENGRWWDIVVHFEWHAREDLDSSRSRRRRHTHDEPNADERAQRGRADEKHPFWPMT
jgi:hypothetical protein